MNNDWLSTADIALLLNLGERRIRDRAINENWESRPRKGRGGGREYRVCSLPADIQALAVKSSAEQQATLSPTFAAGQLLAEKRARKRQIDEAQEQKIREQGAVKFNRLQGKSRARAEAKLTIIAAWTQYLIPYIAAHSKVAGEHEFADAYNRRELALDAAIYQTVSKLSWVTVRRWVTTLETDGIRTIGDERALDLLLSPVPSSGGRPAGVRVANKDAGIVVENISYVAPELGARIGQPLYCSWDPCDISQLYVFEPETMTFICLAKNPELAGLGMSFSELSREARRLQNAAIAEQKKPLRKASNKVSVGSVAMDVLAASSARNSSLMALPHPIEDHQTAALRGANLAAKYDPTQHRMDRTEFERRREEQLQLDQLMEAQRAQPRFRNQTEEFGRPGLGKTTATLKLFNSMDNGVYLRAVRLETSATFLSRLLKELSVRDQPRSKMAMFERVVNVLSMEPRVIFLDEADYYMDQPELLELIRDIHDLTNTTIILVGMNKIACKVAMLPQLDSRISSRYEFQPAAIDDLKAMVRDLLEDGIQVADDLLRRVLTETNGSYRLAAIALENIERKAKVDGIKHIDLARWGSDEKVF